MFLLNCDHRKYSSLSVGHSRRHVDVRDNRKRFSLSLGPKRAWRVMDESTSDHTHPPSRQQAAVGGSRASSKATHAPSAKLWKQVNVHRTLRPLLGPPGARSLHSTSLPYRGYVGGPDGPACTVSRCRERKLPSRLAGS